MMVLLFLCVMCDTQRSLKTHLARLPTDASASAIQSAHLRFWLIYTRQQDVWGNGIRLTMCGIVVFRVAVSEVKIESGGMTKKYLLFVVNDERWLTCLETVCLAVRCPMMMNDDDGDDRAYTD